MYKHKYSSPYSFIYIYTNICAYINIQILLTVAASSTGISK